MKFYLISDNIDTKLGLRLAGIEGKVVHERQALLELLEEKMHDESIAIILLTTKLVELAPDVISELKLRQKKPLIVEIPDRHGQSKIGETIDRYVSEAVGVKLLDYFKQSIAKEADKERLTMITEAKEIRESALEKIRREASLDAKRQMEKEINEIILENQKEISAMQRKTNLELIAKRQELQNKVFEEAKAQLMAYTKQDDYQIFLKSQINQLPLEIYEGQVLIHIANADHSLFEGLKAEFKGEVELVEDASIEIGGFIAINAQRGLVIDNSLDNRLESCKEWFYNHSGLVIQ